MADFTALVVPAKAASMYAASPSSVARIAS
jgi:hypothetical protein